MALGRTDAFGWLAGRCSADLPQAHVAAHVRGARNQLLLQAKEKAKNPPLNLRGGRRWGRA